MDAAWWAGAGGDVLDAVLAELRQVVSGPPSGAPPAWANELRTRLKKTRERLDSERSKAKVQARVSGAAGGVADAAGDGGPPAPPAPAPDAAAADDAFVQTARRVNPPVLSEIQDVCMRRLNECCTGKLKIPPEGMAGEKSTHCHCLRRLAICPCL
jgi:hypothetical protein